MKNVFLLFASVIGLLNISSCSDDSSNKMEIENEFEKEANSNSRKEVIINGYFYDEIVNGTVTTRAIDRTWEKDDAIGLFMKNAGVDLTETVLANNVKLTTDGSGQFSYHQDQKVYFPYNKEKVDFISYHPYRASLNDFNYMIDVSDQTSLPYIDLLYSNNSKDQNSDSGEVNLSFEHQLTKVIFTIADNNSGKDLAGLTARVTNVNTKAIFSLIDGALVDINTPSDVSLNVNNTGTILQGILLPDDDLSNNVLIITIDETNYTYGLDSSEIKSFEKSKKCEYNFNLESANIQGLSATITDWTTVKDDIEVTEVPSTTTPENGDDSGSTEDDAATTPPGEEDNTTEEDTTEEDAIEEDTPIEGDGTKANPYSITQAIQIVENRDSKQSRGILIENVWIKGYIVGFYESANLSTFKNSAKQEAEPRIALAFSPEETDYEKTFPVDISVHHSIREAISLKTNPGNLKKEVLFEGDIGFLTVSNDGDLYGLMKLKVLIKDGISY